MLITRLAVPRRLLAVLALCASVLAPAAANAQTAGAAAEPTIVFLVRHAEKADTTDQSPLTAAGTARAAELANALQDARVTAIFTSAVRRTKDTAAPTAQRLGLTPAVLDASAAAQRTQVLKPAQRALIVGHSNTVPQIIEALGGPKVTIADDEFDALFVLTVPANGSGTPTLVTLRYGQHATGANASGTPGMRRQ